MKLKFIFLLITFTLCGFSFAQKKVIDEASYALWKRVDNYQLSPDGRYVTYKYAYTDNSEEDAKIENKYYLFDNTTKKTIVLDSASNLTFSPSGAWLTFQQGKTTMLMRLRDKKISQWTKSGSIRFEDKGSLVSYKINDGKDVVYYDLDRGDSTVFTGTGRINLFDDGKMVIYLKKGDQSFDICYGDIYKSANHKTLFSDNTKSLNGYSFNYRSKKGSFQVAEKEGDTDNCNLIYTFSLVDEKVILAFNSDEVKLEKPLYIEESSFSREIGRKYLPFEVYPSKPESPKKYDKEKRDNSVELELWSWNDSISQGVQAISGFREGKIMPYIYVYNCDTKKYYPVVTEPYTSIYYPDALDSEYALLVDENPYSKRRDWEHDLRFDIYLVNMRDGGRKLIRKETTSKPFWSPKGDYAIFYDNEIGAWMSLEPKSLSIKNISASVGVSRESYDKPNPRPSYGMSGWDVNGYILYVNDGYDIWAVDVRGEKASYCLTGEYGKKNNCMVRFVNSDYSSMTINPKLTYDLEITDFKTMNSTMATLHSGGKVAVNCTSSHMIKVLKNSSDGRVYLYHKQSFNDDRDLWISDSKFKKPYKITEANPQQKNYNWGSVEIVEWTTFSGAQNRGLLFLPEGYQKGKSYPTIVNFYEKHTGEKNIYHAPTYSSAMLDVTTYVSNGYIIFMPNVTFKIGEPGKSSYDIVVSGTKALIERGIIDPKRIGLQGHSWSGYQTSYLATKTDIFTCINTGAPIVNMTSGYNGLREGSGLPRMFMYEDWQCRMGETMWEAREKYIESSPILFADKITSPLLIFHCDNDEAVSFSEGRSLYFAMRRLQKPAWLLNYKGQGHFVSKPATQKDWTIRMRQFFDYYLNGTAMPRWMSEGINVNERGYDSKLDYTK